ncbi:hypothetical protein [Streptomyces sp. OR43]|uniref:hypothetical protein n=1 Tax=Streptomyces sp. or43 TaxID=2478957 RepID=UPI0011CE2959|nr:hypothetical protein [Streptomyces sp. or43]TXS49438.1 hypothetical protein EAO72_00565 [Streptomyces sp. or43]
MPFRFGRSGRVHRRPAARTTAVVRKPAQDTRLMGPRSAPAVAVRDFVMSTLSRLGPGLVPGTFDGIADRRPAPHTYAAGTKEAQGPAVVGLHGGGPRRAALNSEKETL